MALRLTRQRPARPMSALERRVAKIATPDLTSWAEQTLGGIGRAISDWRRSSDGPSLEEAELGAEALLAVIREMRRRNV